MKPDRMTAILSVRMEENAMTVMENYQAWLAMAADEPALMSELEAVRDQPEGIEDRFYTELSFGTAGMRGVLGAGTNRMNIFNVRRLSAGLADYVKNLPGGAERGIVIGFDSRRMSPEFAREAALVFAARGVKAMLFDALRPVPIVSYAVRHLNAIAGVVITASHNPPQYNGYKVYAEDGAQVGPGMAKGISDLVFSLPYSACQPMDESEAQKSGLLTSIGDKEIDDSYIKMVLGLLITPELVRERGKDLKIVYTPLHGSGNIPVRRALKEAGIVNVTVVPEQELPDPDFSTVSAPNPEDPNAFRLAIPLAGQVGASVIFGTDPDCDRLGVCVRDGEGVYRTLSGNQIGCLLLHHVLEGRRRAGTLPRNGAVCKSIVSTGMARSICEGYGVKLFDTLTGFKYIGEKIQQFEESGEYSFLFGFEESFGYLSGTSVRDKDGVNASLLIAEAACACMAEGITLYDRLQGLYREFGYYHEDVLSITLPGKEGLENMKVLMKRLREEPLKEVAGMPVKAALDYLKGIRTEDGRQEKLDYPSSDVLFYELEGGHWCCVRPSGTEPKIKVYVNTHSARGMEQARALGAKVMEDMKGLLK